VAATKTIDMSLRHFSKYVIKVNDVKYAVSGGWHNDTLDYAVQRGLLDNYIADGSLDAAQGVTRGDFVASVMKAMGIQPLDAFEAEQFNDVLDGDPNAAYLRTAKELGVVSGVDAAHTIFQPDKVATRGEQFQVVYNLIKAGLTNARQKDTGRGLSFASDADAIPGWLRPAVAELLKLGVVEGDDARRLNAANDFTVGETAAVLDRLS
jgi:hypothetical protein